MGENVLVRSGDAEFFVEVVDTGGRTGVRNVDADDAFSIDGVRDTVKTIATKLAEVWDEVKPAEATVEFGLQVTAKTGKLTGLLVEGGGEASIKVCLTWKPST